MIHDKQTGAVCFSGAVGPESSYAVKTTMPRVRNVLIDKDDRFI